MSSITFHEALRVYREADCLWGKEQVDAAYDRMAAAITRRLGGSNPLAIAVMVGGVIPAGQLLSRLDFPLEVDYLHATRYRGQTQGGELHWIMRPSTSLAGRTVLLVDDIHDEGVTLAAIRDACLEAGAREVCTAVLVNKSHDRKNGMRADFAGLDVEDRYVFGCGMDYKGYWRNLPAVYAVREHTS